MEVRDNSSGEDGSQWKLMSVRKWTACFNVHSGEIEDAPAPDRLATFEVTEKNGGVYIKGDESDLKNGRKSTNVKCSSTGGDKVVVVGG